MTKQASGNGEFATDIVSLEIIRGKLLAVADEMNSNLLVQRAIRGVGHCDFTAAEFSTAFLDLVAWEQFGVVPGGDDFLDPANVADPLFGCTYTDGPHLFGTPCP